VNTRGKTPLSFPEICLGFVGDIGPVGVPGCEDTAVMVFLNRASYNSHICLAKRLSPCVLTLSTWPVHS
jgi:hypothetical protein